MKALAFLFGLLLSLLGAILTYSGWFGPQIGDGFTNIGYITFGPLALLTGFGLLIVGYPRNAATNISRPRK
ncbi:hypothetical protein [Parasphingorhabdus sp.]|uniref:hypothetical protein n=1 Tax=Parasphingorhabdus sp. TaxID=2709688 RepID=UPI003C70B684